jgi:DegV family protein with EDD domain
MAKVGVVTDSCASIPPGLVAELGVKVIPYFVTCEGRTLRDLIDVRQAEFFEYLRKTPVLPTTAKSRAGEYLAAFTELAPHVTGIVTAHMTSLGSGAYQAAGLARDMLKTQFPELPIEVVDTRNVSMGRGWFALEAARAVARGWFVAQIAAIMKPMLPVTRIEQTAETLDYLYKGGRIGRASHMVGTLLRIKPVITMDDGVIAPIAQVRARNMGQGLSEDDRRRPGEMG